MIGAIENAICARLHSATGLLGYRLKTVATYDNQFDGKDDLARAVSGLPGAWVVWLGDSSAQPMGQASWKVKARFAVLVAAQNKRNHTNARHGEPGMVGSYQIARDVQTLLVDQTLGLEIDPFALVGSKPLANAKTNGGSVSILTLEFATAYTIAALPDGLEAALAQGETLAEAFDKTAGLGDFATFAGTWDPPVTDLIELETGP